MSYATSTASFSGIAAVLINQVSPYAKDLTSESIAKLESLGQLLDIPPSAALVDGSTTFTAWASSVMQDNPATPGAEFFTVIVAVQNGAPWLKPNGMPVCTYYWHTVPDAILASTLPDDIRAGLLLFAMGEPQKSTPPIIEDSLDTIQSQLSIVTRVNAAIRIAATPGAAL